VKDENSNSKKKEISRLLGVEWASLTRRTRSPYEHMGDLEKRRSDRQRKEWAEESMYRNDAGREEKIFWKSKKDVWEWKEAHGAKVGVEDPGEGPT
jgi:hypothetical protein